MKAVFASFAILASAFAQQQVPASKQPPFTAATSATPAGLEDQLKERVNRFYGLQAEGSFRRSESLVCEDSKDAYYGANKRKWTSVEISRVEFAEGFKDARAVVMLGSTISARDFTFPTKFALNTVWHFEEGNWCYHIPPNTNKEVSTPFGPMMIGNTDKAAPMPVYPGPRVTVKDLRDLVKFDSTEVRLNPKDRSSGVIDIYNGAPGEVEIHTQGAETPGLECTFSATKLKAGEHAKLTVTYQPQPGDKTELKGFSFNVVIEPLTQAQSIQVLFTPPPAK